MFALDMLFTLILWNHDMSEGKYVEFSFSLQSKNSKSFHLLPHWSRRIWKEAHFSSVGVDNVGKVYRMETQNQAWRGTALMMLKKG